jgi:hypothetical protein
LTLLDLFDGNLSQPNALDGRPDDGQTTHLGGEHVDLIGALAHIAKETLDGVGRSDGAMPGLASTRKT